MPFKIIYKFKEDEKSYTCYVTHEQFKNFKNLDIIEKCVIVKEKEKEHQEYKEEMQKAINSATKNNSTHIRKLSEIVDSTI